MFGWTNPRQPLHYAVEGDARRGVIACILTQFIYGGADSGRNAPSGSLNPRGRYDFSNQAKVPTNLRHFLIGHMPVRICRFDNKSPLHFYNRLVKFYAFIYN